MSDLLKYNILDAAIDSCSVKRTIDSITLRKIASAEEVGATIKSLLTDKLISIYIYKDGKKFLIEPSKFIIDSDEQARNLILDQNGNTFEAYKKFFKKFDM